MEVTLFGMVIAVRLLQPSNAPSPIEVTLFGMVMEVRLLQPENALLPMEVTLPSVGMTLLLQPTIKVLISVSIMQFPAL